MFMKKRILITILMFALLSWMAIGAAGCNRSQLNMSQIASYLEYYGFIVESEDAVPILFAMRTDGTNFDSIILLEFSTRAGVEGWLELSDDIIASTQYLQDDYGNIIYDLYGSPIAIRPFYGQVVGYYELFVWLATPKAHQIVKSFIHAA